MIVKCGIENAYPSSDLSRALETQDGIQRFWMSRNSIDFVSARQWLPTSLTDCDKEVTDFIFEFHPPILASKEAVGTIL